MPPKSSAWFPTSWNPLCLLLLASLLLTACQAAVAGEPAGLPSVGVTMISGSLETPTRDSTLTPSTPAPNPSPSISPTHTTSPFPSMTANRVAEPAATLTQTPSSAAREMVPILLYHRVSDHGSSRYILSVADFRAQMDNLAAEGYQAITISRLAEAIRAGEKLPEKTVVLTFDDGYLDTYANAFPILQEHHFIGTAYVIIGTIGTDKAYGYMQVDELKALHQAGWEIGSHSISHTDVRKSKLGLGTEIKQSREDLEALLGFPVRSFAYPFGLATDWIKQQMPAYGYDSAVGLGTLDIHTVKSLYYFSRREVTRGMSLTTFRGLLTPDKDEREAEQYFARQTLEAGQTMKAETAQAAQTLTPTP